jgi:hypothetical protein
MSQAAAELNEQINTCRSSYLLERQTNVTHSESSKKRTLSEQELSSVKLIKSSNDQGTSTLPEFQKSFIEFALTNKVL